MTAKQAIKILERHNKWRRGSNIKHPSPKELGVAIDIAVFLLKIELKEQSIDRFHIHPREV